MLAPLLLPVLLVPQDGPQALRVTDGIAPFQVLQRAADGTAEVTCAGTGTAGRIDVQVTRGATTVAAGTAEAQDGKFRVAVPTVPAGGPYKLTVRAGAAVVSVEPFFVGDLWVLAGQSNMEGVGVLEGLPEPHPEVMCFESRDQWAVAAEPLHWLAESPDPVHWRFKPEEREQVMRQARAGRRSGAGPGLSFGRELVRRAGVPIGLLPCAHGGTSMGQWSPALGAEGGKSLYGSMLRRVRAVGGRVRGVLWYQGESDALAGPEAAAAYEEKLVAFVAAVRKDLGEEKLPFVCVQLGRLVDPRRDAAGWNVVRAAQRRLPSRVPGTAVVAAVDLGLDDAIHVGAAGQVRLGARLAKAAARLLGAAGPEAGPDLVSAKLEGEQGLRVRLVFGGVNGGLRPARHIGGFTVVVGGKAVDWVFDASVDAERPKEVVLRMRGALPEGAEVWYGFGLNPYCNLVDGEDLAALAFGPVVLEKGK